MDDKQILDRVERAARSVDLPGDRYEDLLRRRDRKRRNQRIEAGVVGIAVFVSAIWIVTSVESPNRSQTPVVPGDDVTGPAETGPTVAPETGSDDYSYRIPPAGTAVSTPVEGELIADFKGYEGFDGYVVRVYADGRVLWWDWFGPPCGGSSCLGGVPFVERRLSPEGVELVRSGAVQSKDLPGLRSLVPESAWEDRAGKPYVPARYLACFWRTDSPPTDGPLDFEALLDPLPAPAQALLRGSDPALNPRCLEVTPEGARSLEEIMSQARSSRGDDPYEVGAWSLRDGNGDQVGISLHPLFPDGHRFAQPGF
jgi:hypothetical protein